MQPRPSLALSSVPSLLDSSRHSCSALQCCTARWILKQSLKPLQGNPLRPIILSTTTLTRNQSSNLRDLDPSNPLAHSRNSLPRRPHTNRSVRLKRLRTSQFATNLGLRTRQRINRLSGNRHRPSKSPSPRLVTSSECNCNLYNRVYIPRIVDGFSRLYRFRTVATTV